MSMKPIISTQWNVEAIKQLPQHSTALGFQVVPCTPGVNITCHSPIGSQCTGGGGGGYAPPFGCFDVHMPMSTPLEQSGN